MFVFLLEVAASLTALFIAGWFLIALLSDADVLLMLRTKFGKQPESLAGKVVWITGASSGIGEFYAYCLAESGCKLVLSARREEELERVKKTCLASAKCKVGEEDILILPLDLIDFANHELKVKEVLEYFGKIDILINNAGKSQRALFMDIELEVDREIFEVNVLGPVSLTQAVLPHMIERKEGHIVVVSSLAGKMGAPMSRSYTGSKHATQGYFDCLRTEMAGNNIDVSIIVPGPVYSNIFLYAAKGKKGEMMGNAMNLNEKRMTRERCAYLSCVAIANRQYEAWVTINPWLVVTYFFQFVPDFAKWCMIKVGTKQLNKMRGGH